MHHEDNKIITSLCLCCFQVSGLQTQLKEQTDRCGSLSEQLATAETQSEERATTINSLTQDVERLRQEVKVVIDPLGLTYHF